jgi:deoxyribose-phosphate aldolase
MEPKLISVTQIARAIDHALLRPEQTLAELREGCALAARYGAISVCARPSDLPVVAGELAGTETRATTVIAFPHGAATTESKVAETLDAIAKGAAEVDMVLNIGRLRSGEHDYVERDIRAVVEAAHGKSVLVKVIFENHYLSDEQKIVACRLAESAGADFVKTSTGYAASGATIRDLVLMRKSCGPRVQVKAAGGVRTIDQALAVLATGATRIGTSSTAAIIEEARKRADRNGELPFAPTGDQLSSGY